VQDLADALPDLRKVSAGHDLSFNLTIVVKSKERPSDKVVEAMNRVLKGTGLDASVE
jgi:hypothetical protein